MSSERRLVESCHTNSTAPMTRIVPIHDVSCLCALIHARARSENGGGCSLTGPAPVVPVVLPMRVAVCVAITAPRNVQCSMFIDHWTLIIGHWSLPVPLG